jgi:hypothetical protein
MFSPSTSLCFLTLKLNAISKTLISKFEMIYICDNQVAKVSSTWFLSLVHLVVETTSRRDLHHFKCIIHTLYASDPLSYP